MGRELKALNVKNDFGSWMKERLWVVSSKL